MTYSPSPDSLCNTSFLCLLLLFSKKHDWSPDHNETYLGMTRGPNIVTRQCCTTATLVLNLDAVHEAPQPCCVGAQVDLDPLKLVHRRVIENGGHTTSSPFPMAHLSNRLCDLICQLHDSDKTP